MNEAPSLLPVLKSRLQGELLAVTLLHPEREYTIAELAIHLGVRHTTVLREANRLIEGGILTERRVGRSRLLKARTDTPVYRPLSELVSFAFGPVPVLTEALAGFEGVQQAYIYGSWAARYHNEPGPPPDDIDVLVVGEPDPDDLFDLAEETSRRLRHEVNIHRITPMAWDAPSNDPFLTSVRERPLVQLQLNRETQR